MLKRWWIRFDPSTEYFSYCHLWVLLPILPLQLWNIKALEAIGSVLGCFIKVDEEALQSLKKRMEKVLVEVDIHVGLLETLEIEWRGLLLVQRLDYLGIPFRCTLYRRTGHLWKDFQQVYEDSVEEDSSKDLQSNCYTSVMDCQ